MAKLRYFEKSKTFVLFFFFPSVGFAGFGTSASSGISASPLKDDIMKWTAVMFGPAGATQPLAALGELEPLMTCCFFKSLEMPWGFGFH